MARVGSQPGGRSGSPTDRPAMPWARPGRSPLAGQRGNGEGRNRTGDTTIFRRAQLSVSAGAMPVSAVVDRAAGAAPDRSRRTHGRYWLPVWLPEFRFGGPHSSGSAFRHLRLIPAVTRINLSHLKRKDNAAEARHIGLRVGAAPSVAHETAFIAAVVAALPLATGGRLVIGAFPRSNLGSLRCVAWAPLETRLPMRNCWLLEATW
jgi:hypothetical protein